MRKTLRVKHDLTSRDPQGASLTAALKGAPRYLFEHSNRRLARRADYDCVAAEVKVVVVHRGVQDSGNGASSQQ